jgi:hypothetical protein
MESESEHMCEDSYASDTSGKPDVQPSNANQNIAPISSISDPPPPNNHCVIAYKPEKDWWDKCKPFVEIAGIVILGVYTTYTIKIYRANHDTAIAAQKTLCEIQKQTTLTRQQLVGSQAAVVNVWPSPGIENPPEMTSSGIGSPGFNIAFKNDGNIIANGFYARLKNHRIILPSEKAASDPLPCDFDLPILSKEKPKDFQCSLVGFLTEKVWLSMEKLNQTIAVDGTYSYGNGFGEQVTEKVCLRFVPQVRTKYGLDGDGNFVSCDRFPATLDRLMKRRAER